MSQAVKVTGLSPENFHPLGLIFRATYSSPFVYELKAEHKSALPLMVEVTGLEPAASCSQSRHSSQTELHLVMYGAVRLFI